jgi:hypothetical protein
MSRPTLPVITLRRGEWTAEVYDPRADPAALGARYVHGCYVRALLRGGRCLTTRLTGAWDRFDGEGLPETFESSYGWGATPVGEEFLRIGAGRQRRTGNHPGEVMALAPLCVALDWEILERGDDHLTMAAEDQLLWSVGKRYGYRIERRVRLLDDGLESWTRLKLWCGHWGGHHIDWFAHPFFAQDRIDATALTFPGEPTVEGALVRGDDGTWHANEHHGRAVASGLWGAREPIVVQLDPRRGGGRLALELDRPLDHAVTFAANHSFSVEPKLARAWNHGETAEWALRYRWLG